MENNKTNELYHYGVLGMKWGHRKALSLLAQHNHNITRNSAKEQLKQKNISKQQYNDIIKRSNNDRKTYMKEQVKQFKQIKNKEAYNKQANKLKSEYANKVTNGKEAQKQMRRNTGVAIMNTTLGVSGAAIAVGQTAALALVPGLREVAIGAAAISTITNIGRAYIKNKKIKNSI